MGVISAAAAAAAILAASAAAVIAAAAAAAAAVFTCTVGLTVRGATRGRKTRSGGFDEQIQHTLM